MIRSCGQAVFIVFSGHTVNSFSAVERSAVNDIVHLQRHSRGVAVAGFLVDVVRDDVKQQIAVNAVRNDKLCSDRVQGFSAARSNQFLQDTPRNVAARRNTSHCVNFHVGFVEPFFDKGSKENITFSHVSIYPLVKFRSSRPKTA